MTGGFRNLVTGSLPKTEAVPTPGILPALHGLTEGAYPIKVHPLDAFYDRGGTFPIIFFLNDGDP